MLDSRPIRDIITWIPVWVDVPDHYICVLVSYTYYDDDGRGFSAQNWWRGAGHLNEDGTWSIYGENEELSPFQVAAWADIPDPPVPVMKTAKACDMQPARVEEDPQSQTCERRPSPSDQRRV